MQGSGAREIDKLFTDDIVERRLEPVARLDRFSRSALLNPNFMLFACTHRLALASIVFPCNGFVADRFPAEITACQLRWRPRIQCDALADCSAWRRFNKSARSSASSRERPT